MGKFDGVLLCSDYDGTLFYDGFVESNIEALNAFMAEGGRFTLCTGRRAMQAPMDVVPNAPVVGMCGSEVCDLATGERLALWPMGEEWRGIARDLRQRDDLAHIRFDSEDSPHVFEIDDPAMTDFIDTYNGVMCRITFLYKELRTDPLLVPPEVRTICEGRCAVMSNGNDEFELVAYGMDKGHGVRYLQEKLGAKLLVCVGDYDGDISMLRAADIGYAVDNASPYVKAEADRVTVHATEGVIRHILADLEKDLQA